MSVFFRLVAGGCLLAAIYSDTREIPLMLSATLSYLIALEIKYGVKR